MTPNNPSPPPPVVRPANPTPSAPTPPGPRKRNWLLIGCAGFLGLILLLVATVAITVWWIQRPIKPVVLSEKEKVEVEKKLEHLNGGKSPSYAPAKRAPDDHSPLELPAGANSDNPNRQRGTYTPGSKKLILTEREINGLLNQNTDLGNSVRLEFDRDAVNAYVVVPIPKDFPIGGGRMFRARGRFGLSIDSKGAPYASLEDVTVFGLSLPKAWLGGIKGENLLDQATGNRNGGPVLRGIKSLHVEPGALVLEVED